MQTALTEGTVARVPAKVPAKYKAPKIDRPAVERTLATFGKPTNLPGFRFPIGSKVRTISGAVEWTITAQAETPAGTSPRSYKAVAGRMERVFGENALVAAEQPAKLKFVTVAKDPSDGQIKPVDAKSAEAALIAEYGPARLPGTFGSGQKAPKISQGVPSPRANAPFGQADVVTLLVANPKKVGSKAHARWAAGYPGQGGTVVVADALKAGILMADLKYDVAHKFIKVARA